MTAADAVGIVFGRRPRPYALAACLSSTVLAVLLWGGTGVWGDHHDVWSVATAVAATASAVLLAAGWALSSRAFLEHGLLLNAGVFAARGAYIWIVGGNFWTAALSLTWVVASGGAYLMERTATGPPGAPRRR